jgi:hypothetical protein
MHSSSARSDSIIMQHFILPLMQRNLSTKDVLEQERLHCALCRAECYVLTHKAQRLACNENFAFKATARGQMISLTVAVKGWVVFGRPRRMERTLFGERGQRMEPMRKAACNQLGGCYDGGFPRHRLLFW